MQKEMRLGYMPKRGLMSGQSASCWQEALVTGNGKTGALVYGDPLKETIILNHEKLYEPFHDEVVQNNDLSPYLGEIRTLMKNGRFRDAAELFSDKSGHPLLFTDAFHPAYALKFQMESTGPVYDYLRTVDFETGEVKVHWKDAADEYIRKLFISRADNVIVLQMTAKQGTVINGELAIDDFVHEGSAERCEIGSENNTLSFSCAYAKTSKGYTGLSVVHTNCGSVTAEKEKLVITDAKEVLILTKIAPLENKRAAYDKQNKLYEDILSVIHHGYPALLKRHVNVHGSIFNRVSFTINEELDENVTTEELLAKKTSGVNKQLLQKMFDMGRYVFLCASGDYPPNLVGLWTGEWRPAWSGDFTTDANVNLAVSGGGIGNMPEAMEGYFRLIEKIAPDWKINAKTMYGCRGFLAGCRTDGNHNIHTHFNVDWPLGFWTAGAQWLVLPFYEWYQISGDTKFFLERTLPLMKEIALFYEDFLTEYDENGKAMFIPSYSPENTPAIREDLLDRGWQPSQATINATMDIAVAKELYTYLIAACEELGVEQDNIPKWKEMLEKLPGYQINDDGALKEWVHKDLDDNYDHRHISHLYPVWPGHEITPDANRDLFQAAVTALWKKGRENYSAHGVMHSGIVGARMKKPEVVLENMRLLLEEGDYIYSSLVTSHNPSREIYNVDASCSLPTLVMEMTAYTYPGVLELLPAVPAELSKGTIKGMLGRGQLLLEELTWDLAAKKISVTVTSRKDQVVDIIVRQGIEEIEAVKTSVAMERKNRTTVALALKKNVPSTFEIILE
ncbi:Glycosyl hydrolase family 65, N-terminal domain [Evansella caseinilytica]|uniref:Glycosyl hydrolase family 65, N-terminal domain n=1 Tax=Evansella caseinilytica TaxID=1503961 RepID=A0A1H3QZS6_9BACI|nr:glycoside hydrolase N-terminal domain-containing protein [Evansella caseinilytica]SDZ19092.1 Glycosyl hydrolase family 65, N-terminal domain [Evansella caseinilytica]